MLFARFLPYTECPPLTVHLFLKNYLLLASLRYVFTHTLTHIRAHKYVGWSMAIWFSITCKRQIGIVVEYQINRNCLSLTRPQSIVNKLAINKCATYSGPLPRPVPSGHLPLASDVISISHFALFVNHLIYIAHSATKLLLNRAAAGR